jgi:hypothetical protein
VFLFSPSLPLSNNRGSKRKEEPHPQILLAQLILSLDEDIADFEIHSQTEMKMINSNLNVYFDNYYDKDRAINNECN